MEYAAKQVAAQRRTARQRPQSTDNRLAEASLADEHFSLRMESEKAHEAFQRARRQLSDIEADILRKDDLRRDAAASRNRSTPVTTLLNWKVLPAGHWLIGGSRTGAGKGGNGTQTGGRIELLDSLGPLHWYQGSHLGETVYLVAEFSNVAIADTQDYGNALYYCLRSQGDWKRIFQLDKQEARKAGARRIIHTGEWEERVRGLVGR